MGCGPRPDRRRSPGERCLEPRPPASPATSSRWRACAARPSTCCSSSSWGRGRSGSPGHRPSKRSLGRPARTGASIAMESLDDATVPRFLVRDRDSKFTRAFDDVFAADGTKIIKTPVQAPNANAHAERWVRTVRQECLDWMLLWGRRHLEGILVVRAALQPRAAAPRPGASPTKGMEIGWRLVGSRPPSALGAGIASAAWFTSTTRSRHDVRVSEPNGPSFASAAKATAAPGRTAATAVVGSSGDHRGQVAPLANSQLSNHDRLLAPTVSVRSSWCPV
jgi:hypothetical protein